MERFLVKFMTDAGFMVEICVPAPSGFEGAMRTLEAFRRARHQVATKHPGIGNLTLFKMEEGILSDLGWCKLRDAVVIDEPQLTGEKP